MCHHRHSVAAAMSPPQASSDEGSSEGDDRSEGVVVGAAGSADKGSRRRKPRCRKPRTETVICPPPFHAPVSVVLGWIAEYGLALQDMPRPVAAVWSSVRSHSTTGFTPIMARGGSW